MNNKRFWGYNLKEDAETYWGKELLDSGVKTTKIIDVVDDTTKWPQTSSKQIVLTRIELKDDIISY